MNIGYGVKIRAYLPVIKFVAPGPDVLIVAAKPFPTLEYASAIIAPAYNAEHKYKIYPFYLKMNQQQMLLLLLLVQILS